jgi:hypothetical protein
MPKYIQNNLLINLRICPASFRKVSNSNTRGKRDMATTWKWLWPNLRYYSDVFILLNILIFYIYKTAFIAHNTTSNVEFY